VEAADFRATGRLVQVAANGVRTTYKLTLKAHWFGDGLRLICELAAPAQPRILIHLNPQGRLTVEVAKRGDKTPLPLPSERWGDGLLSTNFSYEDLIERQFFWTRQTLLPAAKFGARDCLVLKSEPDAAEHSQYRAVTSWIDRRSGAPVYIEKTERSSGQVKQFTAFGLRQTGGVWSASQVEVKVQGGSASSLLIIERGSANAKLSRADFDAAQLTRP
jgi:hypothetical protein